MIRKPHCTDILKTDINYPLSDTELLRLGGKKCKIVLYSDLKYFKSLDELFGDKKCVFLLYQLQNSVNGHWTCLIRHDNGLEFYDPYASLPDEKYLIKFNKDSPSYLVDLILKDKKIKSIIYNENQHQRLAHNVSTCGRWCALRWLFRDIDVDDFHKIFKNDEMVVRLTNGLF